MGNHHNLATHKAERDKTLLIVGETVILEGECRALEDLRGIGKIEPVLAPIGLPLGFIPGEVHDMILHIFMQIFKEVKDVKSAISCLVPFDRESQGH